MIDFQGGGTQKMLGILCVTCAFVENRSGCQTLAFPNSLLLNPAFVSYPYICPSNFKT
jgi:hypothetical protein